jgi:putative glycerol-1-phosphate prenyltransferase
MKRIGTDIIKKVNELGNPLIVGGGIRTLTEIKEAHNAGANLVVIGSKIEDNPSFLNELKQYRHSI